MTTWVNPQRIRVDVIEYLRSNASSASPLLVRLLRNLPPEGRSAFTVEQLELLSAASQSPSAVHVIDYRAEGVRSMNAFVAKYVQGHYVTDHWPTFNIADVAICVGVGLMAVDMFTSRRGLSDTVHTVAAPVAPAPADVKAEEAPSDEATKAEEAPSDEATKAEEAPSEEAAKADSETAEAPAAADEESKESA